MVAHKGVEIYLMTSFLIFSGENSHIAAVLAPCLSAPSVANYQQQTALLRSILLCRP